MTNVSRVVSLSQPASPSVIASAPIDGIVIRTKRRASPAGVRGSIFFSTTTTGTQTDESFEVEYTQEEELKDLRLEVKNLNKELLSFSSITCTHAHALTRHHLYLRMTLCMTLCICVCSCDADSNTDLLRRCCKLEENKDKLQRVRILLQAHSCCFRRRWHVRSSGSRRSRSNRKPRRPYRSYSNRDLADTLKFAALSPSLRQASKRLNMSRRSLQRYMHKWIADEEPEEYIVTENRGRHSVLSDAQQTDLLLSVTDLIKKDLFVNDDHLTRLVHYKYGIKVSLSVARAWRKRHHFSSIKPSFSRSAAADEHADWIERQFIRDVLKVSITTRTHTHRHTHVQIFQK